MPVLVTAADTPFGERLVGRLLAQGGEVRAYCTGGGDVAAIRSAGAFVAVGDLDDEGRLEAAMTDAHTVVHWQVGPLASSAEVLRRDAGVVVRAAANAGVQRLIVRSVAGAGGADPLRAVAGEIEGALRMAPVPSVVLRPSLVDTSGLRDALASARLHPEMRETVVAPVREEDLVAVVVALDAVRSTAHRGHVVFTADGPARMTLGEYLARVGLGDPTPAGHLVGHVWRPSASVPLLGPALGGSWVADPGLPDVWSFTGVAPTPLASADTER